MYLVQHTCTEKTLLRFPLVGGLKANIPDYQLYNMSTKWSDKKLLTDHRGSPLYRFQFHLPPSKPKRTVCTFKDLTFNTELKSHLPDAKDDGKVEVVDPDGPGGQEDVDEAGEGVDQVQEVVQCDHPVALDEVELDDIRVEGDPVDEGDPEGDGGETALEAPGDAVGRGEGRKGVRRAYSASDNHTGVDKVVDDQEGDALVGHVDEPLGAEGVEGGHEVAEHPDEHEEGDGDAVDDVPEGGSTAAIPSTAEKIDV